MSGNSRLYRRLFPLETLHANSVFGDCYHEPRLHEISMIAIDIHICAFLSLMCLLNLTQNRYRISTLQTLLGFSNESHVLSWAREIGLPVLEEHPNPPRYVLLKAAELGMWML